MSAQKNPPRTRRAAERRVRAMREKKKNTALPAGTERHGAAANRENGFLRFTERRETVLVAVLLILGAAVRLALLGALPVGLNQDEASAGYDAFALLTAGIDRNGDAWPVLFASWGSGQNVLMSYLALPFIRLLGLTELAVRLPNALAGCLTLPVFWLLARRCGGKSFGVTALFFLAVNPWHIMATRWALESNLLPFCLITGIWLTAEAEEHPWALAGAAAAFALSLYAYGAAFLFLPPFLIAAAVWLGRRKKLRPLPFSVSALLFLLLGAPVALCQLRNALGLEELRLLWFTLPRLTEGRQNAVTVLGGGSVRENLAELGRILLRQNDGLPWNSLPLAKGGLFYFFGLPAAALGFGWSVFRRREHPEEFLMRAALVCALLCAGLIRGNINRLNMLWLPMVYFAALGVELIAEALEDFSLLAFAGMAVCFAVFLFSYIAAFGGEGNVNYFPGLGDAVRYAAARSAETGETVYITDYVNAPYIFALFYSEADPARFAETAVYPYPDAAFRPVARFAGWEFARPEDCPLQIQTRWQTDGLRVLAEYGYFAVCLQESE